MPLVVFVCTGNICRSAMAEGLARQRLSDVPGLKFASAGTHHYPGGATGEAVEAAAELGVDISGHRSQPLTSELLADASRAYGMTRHHARAIGRLAPHLGPTLLGSGEIADPYGGTLDDYRRARDELLDAISARARSWRSLTGS